MTDTLLPTFNIVVGNNCTGASWISPIIPDVTVTLLTVVNLDITRKDSASTSFTPFDGVTFCGARTYSYIWISWMSNSALDFSSTGKVSQVTTTKTGDTIRISPTIAAHVGTYKI